MTGRKEFVTAEELQDIFIVVDTAPRTRGIMLVTRSKEEAEELRETDDDFRIIQPSGKEFPTEWF